MSKPKVDSDGFLLVTSKISNKNSTKIPPKLFLLNKQEVDIDVNKAERCILSAVEESRNSDYFQTVYKAVSSNLPPGFVVDIVCFGLGHIGECVISRYQLALLLCLKDFLNARKVSVYDPIFYKSECKVLSNLCLDVLEENSEGIYSISKDSITLAFLPHCPGQLTNNFLWGNWCKELSNCILLSNSFSSLIEKHLEKDLINSVPCIYKISQYVEEICLNNDFKFNDVFNDISVHIFPKEKLEQLDSDFWIKGDRPEYKDVEFITSLMINKLRI